MKFNVKIIPIGKYLSKYNIFVGDTKTISNEDGVELTELLKAYESDFRYPIYLTDSITLYRELIGISAQFLITDITIPTTDTNRINLTLGTSKSNEAYAFTVLYNTTNKTYSIMLGE